MMLSRIRALLSGEATAAPPAEPKPRDCCPPEYGYAMMAAQEELLASCLSEEPRKAKTQRQAITDAVAKCFMNLVVDLSPNVVAEIGAHEASFSCSMKRQLSGARVIAFEANPEVYERKKAQTGRARVDYRNQCVGNRAGQVKIRVPISNSRTKNTMGSLLVDTRARNFKTFQVDSVTADEAIGGVDNALWIDVEGAIGQVLGGASATLSKCQALYVEVEKTQRWVEQMLDTEVIRRLLNAGLVPVARDIQREWQYNIIFVRPEALDAPRVRAFVASIPRYALEAGLAS